ncbi:hypothetical protein ACOMHN_020381 [Nucella lapillus]
MAESVNVIDSQPESISHDCDGEEFLQAKKLKELKEAQTAEKENVENFPGSKVLQQLNKLEVVQRLDTLEVCLGWTRNNRYCIYNEEGEQVFYVYEASVCFNRQLTGALRGLVLKVSLSDADQEDVLVLRRPMACSSRCCWACCSLQHMEMVLPATGATLASMQEILQHMEMVLPATGATLASMQEM